MNPNDWNAYSSNHRYLRKSASTVSTTLRSRFCLWWNFDVHMVANKGCVSSKLVTKRNKYIFHQNKIAITWKKVCALPKRVYILLRMQNNAANRSSVFNLEIAHSNFDFVYKKHRCCLCRARECEIIWRKNHESKDHWTKHIHLSCADYVCRLSEKTVERIIVAAYIGAIIYASIPIMTGDFEVGLSGLYW